MQEAVNVSWQIGRSTDNHEKHEDDVSHGGHHLGQALDHEVSDL